MQLRGWIKRLERTVQSEGVVLRLEDGRVRAFDNNTVWSEMFLTKCDLLKGKARESEVLDAVRSATPESRAAFEAQYSPIEMEVRIICPVVDGGWVEVRTLTYDGQVVKVRHEGDSPEAERMRLEAQGSSPATF